MVWMCAGVVLPMFISCFVVLMHIWLLWCALLWYWFRWFTIVNFIHTSSNDFGLHKWLLIRCCIFMRLRRRWNGGAVLGRTWRIARWLGWMCILWNVIVTTWRNCHVVFWCNVHFTRFIDDWLLFIHRINVRDDRLFVINIPILFKHTLGKGGCLPLFSLFHGWWT